jgi:hypothetical protein
MRRTQHVADDTRQGPPVGAENRRSKGVLQFQDGGVERDICFHSTLRGGGQMELDLAEHRQDCRGDGHRLRGPAAVDRLGAGIDVGLRAARDLDHPAKEAPRAAVRCEPFLYHCGEHRRHLARRARQHEDARLTVLDPQAGRGAVGVREDGRASRHHRLTAVDVGHRHGAPRKPRTDVFDDGVVELEGHPERARQSVSRDVVFGRAESAGADDQIGRVERSRQHLRQLVDRVADHHFQADVAADGIQALRDDERIRIEAKGRQHLAANGDDPGPHGVNGEINTHRPRSCISMAASSAMAPPRSSGPAIAGRSR